MLCSLMAVGILPADQENSGQFGHSALDRSSLSAQIHPTNQHLAPASSGTRRPVTTYTVKKSELSVDGHFQRPAFALLRPTSNLHSAVTSALSDFCLIQGSDIRITQDTTPLANAEAIYNLRPFNGFAKVNIDGAQLVLLSPHTLSDTLIINLSLALLNAVHKEVDQTSYATFLIQIGFHAELPNINPAAYTGHFVSSEIHYVGSIIGNSATYYLGQEGTRLHSSVTLDMSGEFSECVFVRIAIRYDGSRIAASELPNAVQEHYNELLSLVGLESES